MTLFTIGRGYPTLVVNEGEGVFDTQKRILKYTAIHLLKPRNRAAKLERPFYIATSQSKFLRTTEVGKLWKAMNAKQKQTATVCNNVKRIFNNKKFDLIESLLGMLASVQTSVINTIKCF